VKSISDIATKTDAFGVSLVESMDKIKRAADELLAGAKGKNLTLKEQRETLFGVGINFTDSGSLRQAGEQLRQGGNNPYNLNPDSIRVDPIDAGPTSDANGMSSADFKKLQRDAGIASDILDKGKNIFNFFGAKISGNNPDEFIDNAQSYTGAGGSWK